MLNSLSEISATCSIRTNSILDLLVKHAVCKTPSEQQVES